MERQLVCEGRCNGGKVQEFDELVKHYGRSETAGPRGLATVPNSPKVVLDMARRFVYTMHKVMPGLGRAMCLTCLTYRRWGNSLT